MTRTEFIYYLMLNGVPKEKAEEFAKYFDFESRPKGEWIKGDMFECDLCHHKMIVGDGAYNYCPNCGADMEGE